MLTQQINAARPLLQEAGANNKVCLNNFTEVQRCFTTGMERKLKENLLLMNEKPATILDKLREDHSDKVAEHKGLLQYEP